MTILNALNIPLTGDGKLLIGATGSAIPSSANITAGTGISVTNGAGSVTIANTSVASGYVKYYDSTTPNTTVSSTGNIVTLTLPANTATSDGDVIEIGGHVLLTRSTGTFAGDLKIVAGSSSTIYYSYSLISGTLATGIFARLIRTSSSTAFLDTMMTGVNNSAYAALDTGISIDFTNSATLGTALTISTGTGSAQQRMLWIRVTGK